MKNRKLRARLAIAASLALAVVMCASGYLLVRAEAQYKQENIYHQILLEYKPSAHPEPQAEAESVTNVSLLELQTLYPDVVGWLTIPGTQVDYPFVLAEDNDKYLRADLDLNYLVSGTLFLDYRAAGDLSAFNSVIYGHYMKNGSMFGCIPGFRKGEVFEQYPAGTLQLPYANYELEVFASMLINRYDTNVYNCLQSTEEEKQAFLDYVKEHAAQYRDVGATTQDRFVTLSTCSYEFSDARSVVVCRLVEQTAGAADQN